LRQELIIKKFYRVLINEKSDLPSFLKPISVNGVN
ncbi:MAG: hypothetical protein JWQ09_1533, partial [Segetibacter sp.]|nr:hypothetical protein [Segetibacter sp.]